MDTEDLRNRFRYHQPRTAEVAADHQRVRTACLDLAELVDEFAPDCREKSLAVTAIEEAMMWANAAIARHQGA